MILVYNKTSAATLIQILFSIVPPCRGHVLTGPWLSSHHPLKMAPWCEQFVINYNYSNPLLSLWPCDWWPGQHLSSCYPDPGSQEQSDDISETDDRWQMTKLVIYIMQENNCYQRLHHVQSFLFKFFAKQMDPTILFFFLSSLTYTLYVSRNVETESLLELMTAFCLQFGQMIRWC